MVILYCEQCGTMIRAKDLESGVAVKTAENSARCPQCAKSRAKRPSGYTPSAQEAHAVDPLPRAARASERGIRPVERGPRQSSTSLPAPKPQAQQGSQRLAPARPDAPKTASVLLIAGGVVVAVLLIVIIIVVSSQSSPNPPPKKPDETTTVAAVTPVMPVTPMPSSPEKVPEEGPRPPVGVPDPTKVNPTQPPAKVEDPTPAPNEPVTPPTVPDPKPVEQPVLSPGESRSVKVDSRGDWQDAGVLLKQGQRVRLTAKGRWQTKPGEYFEPKGVGPGGYSGMVVTSLPFMGLIGKPKDGEAFLVGDRWEGTWPKDGGVLFRANDTGTFDNAGSLDVTIEALKEAGPAVPDGLANTSSVKIPYEKIKGGAAYQNWANKGRNSYAVWGKRSPHSNLTASFDLAAAPFAQAVLIVNTFKHDRNEPCQISIHLNGKEIFRGTDPNPNRDWNDDRFAIPPGTLRTGSNDLRIQSEEDVDYEGRAPWFMASAMEVQVTEVIKPGTPEEAVFRAPKKTLESGCVFGPEVARYLQHALRKNPNSAKKILCAGAGWPARELELKPPEGWTLAASPKEITGPNAGPLALLDFLPEALGKENAEVVLLFGDPRKASPAEKLEWEDVARLCLRLGAIPVLVPPVAAGENDKDETRQTLLKLAEQPAYPVLEVQPLAAFPQRAGMLVKLFDKHVFRRVPLTPAGEPKGGEVE
jgi:hypothetical protein